MIEYSINSKILYISFLYFKIAMQKIRKKMNIKNNRK